MTARVCSLYNNGLGLCVTLILLHIIIIYYSLGSVLRALLTLEYYTCAGYITRDRGQELKRSSYEQIRTVYYIQWRISYTPLNIKIHGYTV